MVYEDRCIQHGDVDVGADVDICPGNVPSLNMSNTRGGDNGGGVEEAKEEVVQ